MARSLTPYLMFVGEARAALELYTSLFADAEIHFIREYLSDEPDGGIRLELTRITLAGQTLYIADSSVVHEFGFTPAISLFVECESEAELQRLFAALSADGQVMMPLADYGFSRLFAWCSDRFGVSWQLNLA